MSEVSSASVWLERSMRWLIAGIFFVIPLLYFGTFLFPRVAARGFLLMGLIEVLVGLFAARLLMRENVKIRWGVISSVFLVFVFVKIVTMAIGENPTFSFWSGYDRMSGVLMWLHLFALFIVIGAVIKTREAWYRLFAFVFASSLFIAGVHVLNSLGVEIVDANKTGSTLGNSTYLGTVLVLLLFFAIYVFLTDRNRRRRLLALVTIVTLTAVLVSGNGDAALIAFLGGVVLLAVLWLSFNTRKIGSRALGVSLLGLMIVTFLYGSIFLLVPNSAVQNVFNEHSSRARTIIWSIAWDGFVERPWFGWGPENYQDVFITRYNPCLISSDCGGEVWFDRSHNIVMDQLVEGGAVGLLAYLSLLLIPVVVLFRLRKKDNAHMVGFLVFTALIATYFVQNFTAFDNVTSLLLWVLLLAFAQFFERPLQNCVFSFHGSLSTPFNVRFRTSHGDGHTFNENPSVFQRSAEREKSDGRALSVAWARPIGVILLIALPIMIMSFVVRPWRENLHISRFAENMLYSERSELLHATLNGTPMERIYRRYFIAGLYADTITGLLASTKGDIEQTYRMATELRLEGDLADIRKALEESIVQYPLYLRTHLSLAKLITAQAQVLEQPSLYDEAFSILQNALEVSPNNQQIHWKMSEIRAKQGRFPEALELSELALALEPRYEPAHKQVIAIVLMMHDMDLFLQKAQSFVEYFPQRASMIQELIDQNIVPSTP